jgi:streptomycin 6-kinase
MTSTETQPDINQYLKDWHLSDAQLLAETNTSYVYKCRLNEDFAVLKFLKSLGVVDEKNGAAALVHFGGNGAIRVIEHSDQAFLLEYAAGPDLKSLVQQGNDAQATAIIADTLNQLHKQKSQISTDTFTPLKKWFRSLDTHAQMGVDSFYVQAANIAERLLAHPQDICVLHGDIHHENILYSQRGWLAIDPKGLYGERTYDAANTLFNPFGMDELVLNEARLLKNAEILARSMKINMQRLLQFTFAYSALSASWSLEDNQNPAIALKIGKILTTHID